MSLFKIRRDRTKYTAPVVKLCVALAVVGGAKFGEALVNTLADGRYDAVARIVFCIVAAVCAILCYQALMEMGYVYDRRHPNAAASVGAVDMTVADVMDAIESASDVRVAILCGESTHVVGVRAKSASSEDFRRTYFADSEDLADAEALRENLEALASNGVLTVAAVGELTGKKYVRSLGKGNKE